MSGPGKATERADLRDLWSRWTAVIDQFARRRRGRHRLRGQEYQALHGELLRLCRSLAEGADEQARDLYSRLELVAQPWLTLWALQQADREILLDLLLHCRQAERELGSRRWGWLARVCVKGGLALAAVACLLLLTWGAKVWERLWEWVEDVPRAVRWAVKQPSETGWWLACCCLVSLLTIWLMVRAPRSG